MIKDVTQAKIVPPQESEANLSSPERKYEGKKPFIKPELKRHQSLPEVTTGFFGTFSP